MVASFENDPRSLYQRASLFALKSYYFPVSWVSGQPITVTSVIEPLTEGGKVLGKKKKARTGKRNERERLSSVLRTPSSFLELLPEKDSLWLHCTGKEHSMPTRIRGGAADPAAIIEIPKAIDLQ
jgi:hypothetical protein